MDPLVSPSVPEDVQSDLIDVTGVPLSDLISPASNVLDTVLARLLSELDSREEILPAFQNYVE
jgi:hypothetical protein